MTKKGEIQEQGGDLQRLDKWLNIACLLKTRSQATKACDARRIKVNDEVVKPSKMIKVGDRITIKKTSGQFVNLHVLKLAHRNVSAKDARELYEMEVIELTETEKEMQDLMRKASREYQQKYKGRPTKKERRKLEDVRRSFKPW